MRRVFIFKKTQLKGMEKSNQSCQAGKIDHSSLTTNAATVLDD